VTPPELWHSDWCAGFALTVQNLHTHPGGFKGAGLGGRFYQVHGGRGLPSMFQFWLSGAGGARVVFDIDDTVREITKVP